MLSGSGLAERLRRMRALVFDFDGTLADAEAVKRRAFERCFAGFREQREAIQAYCAGFPQVPRGEKFRHIYERILKQPYTAEVAADLHAQFEADTTRQIITAPEIPGAEAFLRAVQGRHYTALLSTTPHETLLEIVVGRGWQGLFRELRGAPVDKAAWLAGFRTSHGFGGGEVAFFGDTAEDRQAAEAAGCVFVGVRAEDGLASVWIPDFRGLSVDAVR
jgi:phosphoglycolate phosphatase-like HAD superfamily hydrolase